MEIIKKYLAELHYTDSGNTELFFYAAICQTYKSRTLNTFLNFQLDDPEVKILGIIKHNLKLNHTEIQLIQEDIQNFYKQSDKQRWTIDHEFNIGKSFYQIAVNKKNGSVLLLISPTKTSKKITNKKGGFTKKWIFNELKLYKGKQQKYSEIEFLKSIDLINKSDQELFVKQWNKGMLKILPPQNP